MVSPSNEEASGSNILNLPSNKLTIGTFSKILVAIDGSRQSMDAGYYAINMSNKFNAELYAI